MRPKTGWLGTARDGHEIGQTGDERLQIQSILGRMKWNYLVGKWRQLVSDRPHLRVGDGTWNYAEECLG